MSRDLGGVGVGPPKFEVEDDPWLGYVPQYLAEILYIIRNVHIAPNT